MRLERPTDYWDAITGGRKEVKLWLSFIKCKPERLTLERGKDSGDGNVRYTNEPTFARKEDLQKKDPAALWSVHEYSEKKRGQTPRDFHYPYQLAKADG